MNSYEQYLVTPERLGLHTLILEFRGDALRFLQEVLDVDLNERRRSDLFRVEPDVQQPTVIARLLVHIKASLPRKDAARLGDFGPSHYRFGRSPDMRGQYYSLRRVFSPPSRLKAAQKQALTPAHPAFLTSGLGEYTATSENPTKIDFQARKKTHFFQTSEVRSVDCIVTTVHSPDKEPLEAIASLWQAMNVACDVKFTKTFSPEETLLEAYLGAAQLSRAETLFIRQRHLAEVVQQSLEEADEGRHVHAIRAVGIGTEMLVVQIYETIFRDRAPSEPLGALLQKLESRSGQIIGRPDLTPLELDTGEVKRTLGELIVAEKAKATPDPALLGAIVELQRTFVPAVANISKLLAQFIKRFPTETKYRLFPRALHRDLDELIGLRNQVSHRGERGQTAIITHIDTATALRGFIVLSCWWEAERVGIDFGQPVDAVVRGLVERAKKADDAAAKGV